MSIIFSSFIGGSDSDVAYDIAVDNPGSAVIVGQTGSIDFPTRPGSYDRVHNGGFMDIFVTKFREDGSDLLYSTFLKKFLELYKSHRGNNIYLETNGTLSKELKEVVAYVDIIAMDIKLPSSSGDSAEIWSKHKKFFEIASKKELIVKAVITGSTSMDDIKKMVDVIGESEEDFSIVLQPVTPTNSDIKESDEEMNAYFKGYIEKETG